MGLIFRHHVPRPIDDVVGEPIVLGDPAHQTLSLVQEWLLVGYLVPPDLPDVLFGLQIGDYRVGVPRVQEYLQVVPLQLLEMVDGGDVLVVVLENRVGASGPLDRLLHVECLLHSRLVEIVADVEVVGAGRVVLVFGFGCCYFRVVDLMEGSVPQFPSGAFELAFRSVAGASGAIRVHEADIIIGLLLAEQASYDLAIVVGVPAIGEQSVGFGPIVIMGGVELVDDESPPVEVGHHDSVADQDACEFDFAFEVELAVVGVKQSGCEVRDVHPVVGLARNPELVAEIFREFFIPLLEGLHVVRSCP